VLRALQMLSATLSRATTAEINATTNSAVMYPPLGW
jgi:hypothetical protein